MGLLTRQQQIYYLQRGSSKIEARREYVSSDKVSPIFPVDLISSGKTRVNTQLISTVILAGATNTLYTVTTGKTLFISTLYISNTSAADTTITIRDGALPRFTVQVSQAGITAASLAFPYPLVFNSNLTALAGVNNVTATISASGWEEEASRAIS